MWWRIVLVVLALWFGWQQWLLRPLQTPDGVLAPDTPEQEDLEDATPFRHNGYFLTPLAEFALEARVLSRSDYHFGREADLSPTDIAFGWGSMSDNAVLKDIDISQSNRFYFWRTGNPPIPLREIETSSANMHLIPANDSVSRQISRLRVGQVVSLTGKLVEIDAEDGWHWKSSLTRNDTGNGACEVIYVESISVH